VIVVGGITASPFPFGDSASGAEAWWPALQAADLVDPAAVTVLCRAGQAMDRPGAAR